MTDALPSSPAALRNRGPILDVLRRELPRAGTVLEVASGTGEHVAHFAAALPALTWQPSDPDAEARAVIAARTEGQANVLPPLHLDAAAADWPVTRVQAMLCINMLHISPWAATLGLFAGARRVMPQGGLLHVYGPFSVKGRALEPSNAAFDASLRARDAEWGLRDVREVERAATRAGLRLDRVVAMPANNLSLLFRRLS